MSLFLTLLPAFMLGAVAIAMAVYLQQNNAGYQISHSDDKKKSWQRSSSSSTSSQTSQSQKSIIIRNPCGFCGSEIKDLENDLTKLPCDHQFHSNCVSWHFIRNQRNKMADCAVAGCIQKYSLSS